MERKILIFIVIASYRYDILYERNSNKYVTFARKFRHMHVSYAVSEPVTNTKAVTGWI